MAVAQVNRDSKLRHKSRNRTGLAGKVLTEGRVPWGGDEEQRVEGSRVRVEHDCGRVLEASAATHFATIDRAGQSGICGPALPILE